MNTEKTQKKVLLVTRPIAPPWDEASKNFAFYLAKNVTSITFYLLTNGHLQDLPDTVVQKPIYTSNALNLWQKLRLSKLIRLKKEVDIMHFMLTPNKLNSLAFKTFLLSPRVRTIQTVATLREDLFSDQDFKEILFADLIITYSDYAKNKLSALGFPNVQRVYPGIDLSLYSPAPKNEKLLSEFRIQNSEFVIAYPGEYTRLGATDDIVRFILQHSSVLKEKNIKLIFACRVKNSADAHKKDEVIEKLKASDCLDRVVFTDTFADMASLYNLCDVIIFPVQNMQGKFDIPLVVPEAMACEKPVILSDLPILQELTDSQSSVIIPRGDIDALYAAIIDLYDHPEKREAIGKSARAFVQNNFDIKQVAQNYQEIYKQL